MEHIINDIKENKLDIHNFIKLQDFIYDNNIIKKLPKIEIDIETCNLILPNLLYNKQKSIIKKIISPTITKKNKHNFDIENFKKTIYILKLILNNYKTNYPIHELLYKFMWQHSYEKNNIEKTLLMATELFNEYKINNPHNIIFIGKINRVIDKCNKNKKIMEIENNKKNTELANNDIKHEFDEMCRKSTALSIIGYLSIFPDFIPTDKHLSSIIKNNNLTIKEINDIYIQFIKNKHTPSYNIYKEIYSVSRLISSPFHNLIFNDLLKQKNIKLLTSIIDQYGVKKLFEYIENIDLNLFHELIDNYNNKKYRNHDYYYYNYNYMKKSNNDVLIDLYKSLSEFPTQKTLELISCIPSKTDVVDFILKTGVIPNQTCVSNSCKYGLNKYNIITFYNYKLFPNNECLYNLIKQYDINKISGDILFLIDYGMIFNLSHIEILMKNNIYLDNLELFNIPYDESLFKLCIDNNNLENIYMTKYNEINDKK